MVATNSPTVSVVIPTYERPAYLKRAISSVNAQTYDDVEVVVVDDCSNPPVKSAIESLPKDSSLTVTYRRHDENRGANAARNTGIETASGEYIAFLDDDDWWERSKLERQVATFRDAGDGVGVVYTGTQYVNVSGDKTLVTTPTLRGDITRDLLEGGQVEEFSAAMVRASVVEDAGLPDESFPSWQDREWYLRLSRHCEFEVIPDPLTVRQMGHGGQIRDDYEKKRDVSYPLFLEKHRPLAAEYGSRCERRFVGSLTRLLGRSAFKNGFYREAAIHLARSIRYDPVAPDAYTYLLASLGGRHTHHAGQRVIRALRGGLS